MRSDRNIDTLHTLRLIAAFALVGSALAGVTLSFKDFKIEAELVRSIGAILGAAAAGIGFLIGHNR